MNYFLGIDIAKTNHVASLINNNGDVVIRAIKFTNSNEGFNKLLNTIQSKLGDLSNIEVAMEATGHYWLSLYSALTDNNFNVSVYNPYQIKSYRGAYNNRKQKNDIIDSIIIADYLRVFGSKESKFPEEKLLSLKQLTRFRANIVANVSSLKVQVIGLLDKVFPEYKKLFVIPLVIPRSNYYLIVQLLMTLSIFLLLNLLIYYQKILKVDLTKILLFISRKSLSHLLVLNLLLMLVLLKSNNLSIR